LEKSVIPRKDQNQIFEELYHLQNCELALGMFYQELISIFPKDRFFWEEAVSDEINHARMVGQLIVLVSSNIDKFAPGIFRTELLKTYAEGVYSDIKLIKERSITPYDILALALNYERSMLEQKPYNAVRSDATEYLGFVEKFKPELSLHNERLIKYIAQVMQTL
jgi:hypothetical protein